MRCTRAAGSGGAASHIYTWYGRPGRGHSTHTDRGLQIKLRYRQGPTDRDKVQTGATDRDKVQTGAYR